MGLVLCALACSSAAHAVEEEWSVGAGGAIATLPTQENGAFGFGATAQVRYAILDWLGVELGALYAYHLPTPRAAEDVEVGETGVLGTEEPGFHMVIPRLGLTYTFDILTIIPYGFAGVTTYFGTGDVPDPDRGYGVGAAVGVGFLYRPERSWSAGLEFTYHAFAMDMSDFPAYLTVSIGGSWHSDPF